MSDEERADRPAPEKPEETGPGGERRGGPPLPEASFYMLAATLHSQALVHLGLVPEAEGAEVNLDVAKFTIDLLAVLEEKTKGNLAEKETVFLRNVLFELRMKYVEVSREHGGV